MLADSAGGIVLSGYGNRIKVDNTLDERLRLLEELVGPFPLFLDEQTPKS